MIQESIMPDRSGSNIGNYQLLSLIGHGGFADVYSAEHLHLDRKTAIKILHQRLSLTEQSSFKEEARIIAQLEHTRIIQLFDFGIDNGNAYMVMEYLSEGSLRNK